MREAAICFFLGSDIKASLDAIELSFKLDEKKLPVQQHANELYEEYHREEQQERQSYGLELEVLVGQGDLAEGAGVAAGKKMHFLRGKIHSIKEKA